MVWFALCHLFSCLVDLFTVRRLTDAQKDIQILLLRQQVRVLQRKAQQPKRFSRLEKTLLAVLVAQLKRTTSDFRAQVQPVLIFSPATVLRWHRELVRRKWTFRRKAAAGRPKINPEVESLVLQLARENAGWGYDRIEGELVKLGYTIDRSSIRNLLKRHHLLPAPKRRPKSRAGYKLIFSLELGFSIRFFHTLSPLSTSAIVRFSEFIAIYATPNESEHSGMQGKSDVQAYFPVVSNFGQPWIEVD